MQEAAIFRKALGALLADLRADVGLHQGELGDRLDGLRQSGVSRAENGVSNLDLWQLRRYVDALHHPTVGSVTTLYTRLERLLFQLQSEVQRVYDIDTEADGWWTQLTEEQFRMVLPLAVTRLHPPAVTDASAPT